MRKTLLMLLVAGMLISAGGCADLWSDFMYGGLSYEDYHPEVGAYKDWNSIIGKINSRSDWTWQELEPFFYEAQKVGERLIRLVGWPDAYKKGLIETVDWPDAYSMYEVTQMVVSNIRQKVKQLYIEEHPEIDEWIKEFINKGYAARGMTCEQTRISKGRPNDKNVSIGSWGTHEQWVYGECPSASYYYFENGILTSYQY